MNRREPLPRERARRAFLLGAAAAVPAVWATGAARAAPRRPLVERLGRPPGARLLIVHADDLGQSHSINAASFAAFETGLVNSAAALVVCPWFPEVVAYARRHPGLDLGLQLTLACEWETVRWGPVLSPERVPSLVDAHGLLRRGAVAAGLRPDEAEAEMHAQMKRMLSFGVRPTYVDAHMGVVFATPGLFAAYLRVARAHGVPALIPREKLAGSGALAALVRPTDVVLDGKRGVPGAQPAARWAAFYEETLRSLPPGGVYFLEAHLGFDDPEMRAVANGQEPWGAAFRQREYDYLTSARFRALLAETKVELVTWREIAKAAPA